MERVLDVELLARLYAAKFDEGWKEEDHVPPLVQYERAAVGAAELGRQCIGILVCGRRVEREIGN
jgi:hypothetical protein